MNYTPQTPTEKLELTAYNLQAEINVLQETVEALDSFTRKDFRSKWLTNHLQARDIQAYYYGQEYSERLVIQYQAKEYRQSWNDQNESFYGVFPRTERVDVYMNSDTNNVSALQTRITEIAEAREKNLREVEDALKDVAGLQGMIDRRTATIAENQKELGALGYHVRVAFGLVKN